MKNLIALMLIGFSLNAAESDEAAREAKTAYHIVEAILASPDMTTKMPVLEAAFRDTPEWEQNLQKIIARESWSFAKVHFIHFYWKRVSNKNKAFMDREFTFVREYQRTDETLGIVNEMLEAKERPTTTSSTTLSAQAPKISGVQGPELIQLKSAVFRGLIDALPAEGRAERIHFVKFETGEEQELRKLLRGTVIKSAVECQFVDDYPVEKATGERGVVLEIKNLTVIKATAVAYAGHFSGTGTMYSLELEKRNGKWQVTKRKIVESN
jgi:hypothetical protein